MIMNTSDALRVINLGEITADVDRDVVLTKDLRKVTFADSSITLLIFSFIQKLF